MRLEGCASRTPHGIVKFTEGLHRSVRGRQGFLSTRRLDNSRNPPLGRGTVVADARTRRPCLTNLTAGLKCSKTVLCSDLVPQGVPVLPHSPTAAVGCQAFPTGFKPLSQVKCVKVKSASRVPNTGIKAHGHETRWHLLHDSIQSVRFFSFFHHEDHSETGTAGNESATGYE